LGPLEVVEAMLRSSRWFDPDDVGGLLHRASLRAGTGASVRPGTPVVGICNSWSELVHCNVHLRRLAQAVKRGVHEAGGLAVEFPTVSLSENLMKPTTMLYRNLMAMDVEEMIRAHPVDAVVLLGGCDKTVPAQVMGAISAGVPAIVLTGGPSEPGRFRGRELGVGTDIWRYTDDVRAGRMSLEEYHRFEAALIPSAGHCNEMGTASTMAAVCEALGIALSGTALAPAQDPARAQAGVDTGARAVQLATGGPALHELLTRAAFGNAITVLHAIGGATNAVVHLLAFAGRLGLDLPLERFGELSARTPLLVNTRPSGEFLAHDVFAAGGMPAVMRELGDLLALDVMTIDGRTLGEELADARTVDPRVIGTRDAPFGASGALQVVRGSLAPRGAMIKRSAASAQLRRHRGPAVVFDGIDDLAARIDDPGLDVAADSVLVLRGAGPVGGPGMPEWGMVPIPEKLLRAGVNDIVRISDARMSGTGFGTVVLHAAPEAAIGGPIAAARTGDPIILDVDAGVLDLDIPQSEIARRLSELAPSRAGPRRGYRALYAEHVLQADQGCDFDFLRAVPGEPLETLPTGLLSGWLGGW
jgi:dihydroxy-acid dehydratase